MTRTPWIVAAYIALVLHVAAWAGSERSTVEREPASAP